MMAMAVKLQLYFLCLTLFLLIHLTSTQAEAEADEKKSVDVLVMGCVYCDQCFDQKPTKNAIFLQGASIFIKCKDHEGKKMKTIIATTNEKGYFQAKLQEDVNPTCYAHIKSSPKDECKLMGLYMKNYSNFELAYATGDILTYSIGEFTFLPSKLPSFCHQTTSMEPLKEHHIRGSLKSPLYGHKTHVSKSLLYEEKLHWNPKPPFNEPPIKRPSLNRPKLPVDEYLEKRPKWNRRKPRKPINDQPPLDKPPLNGPKPPPLNGPNPSADQPPLQPPPLNGPNPSVDQPPIQPPPLNGPNPLVDQPPLQPPPLNGPYPPVDQPPLDPPPLNGPNHLVYESLVKNPPLNGPRTPKRHIDKLLLETPLVNEIKPLIDQHPWNGPELPNHQVNQSPQKKNLFNASKPHDPLVDQPPLEPPQVNGPNLVVYKAPLDMPMFNGSNPPDPLVDQPPLVTPNPLIDHSPLDPPPLNGPYPLADKPPIEPPPLNGPKPLVDEPPLEMPPKCLVYKSIDAKLSLFEVKSRKLCNPIA
jgi:hypothetical protein